MSDWLNHQRNPHPGNDVKKLLNWTASRAISAAQAPEWRDIGDESVVFFGLRDQLLMDELARVALNQADPRTWFGQTVVAGIAEAKKNVLAASIKASERERKAAMDLAATRETMLLRIAAEVAQQLPRSRAPNQTRVNVPKRINRRLRVALDRLNQAKRSRS